MSFFQIVLSNVLVSVVLAALAFAITRIWRDPHVAHALWLLVLIKLVTPPLFLVSVPSLSTFLNTVVEHGEVSPSDIQAAPMLENKSVAPEPPIILFEPLGELEMDPEIQEIDALVAGASAGTVEQVFRSAADETTATSTGFERDLVRHLAISWELAAAAIWLGGSAILVVMGLPGYLRLRRVLTSATPAGSDLIEEATRLAALLGLRRSPAVLQSSLPVPPLIATFGRRAVVLLPARLFDALDREQQQSVLLHELAHLRRRDLWTRRFEVLVLALFWWCPVAWLASRMLRAAAEECCDAWVLWAMPNARRAYGKALLRTVEFLTERDAVPAVAVTAFGGFPIKRRIEMIMTREASRGLSRTAAVLLFVAGAAVLPVAAQTAAPPGDVAGVGSTDHATGASGSADGLSDVGTSDVTSGAAGSADSGGGIAPPSATNSTSGFGGSSDVAPPSSTSAPARRLGERVGKTPATATYGRYSGGGSASSGGGSGAAPSQASGGGSTDSGGGNLEARIARLEKLVGDLAKSMKPNASLGAGGYGDDMGMAGGYVGTGDTKPQPQDDYRRVVENYYRYRKGDRPDGRWIVSLEADGRKLIALLEPGVAQSEIVAFDIESGKIRWKSTIEGRIEKAASALENNAFSVQVGSQIVSHDISTGKVIQKIELKERPNARYGPSDVKPGTEPAVVLDPVGQPKRVLKVLPLRNAVAVDVVARLMKSFPEGVELAADERTNSIIVSATADALKAVEEETKKLDNAPVPQDTPDRKPVRSVR